MIELDPVIHEEARLLIMALLSRLEEADFLFLLRETGLTKGNLFTHLAKLESSGYISIEKGFRGKKTFTVIRLTPLGRKSFRKYRKSLDLLLSVPDD